jgi:hypothetical protein
MRVIITGRVARFMAKSAPTGTQLRIQRLKDDLSRVMREDEMLRERIGRFFRSLETPINYDSPDKAASENGIEADPSNRSSSAGA